MRRSLIAAAILLLSIFRGGVAGAEMLVQACFSPAGRCAAHIVRVIAQAKRELLVAVYAFTSDELAEALAQAKRRGVTVQVIIDRDFDARAENSQSKFLESNKIALRRISGIQSGRSEKDGGLMHQKFAVIDRNNLLTGSYNWTHAAESSNDENLLLFRDAGPLAEEYRKIFMRLWARQP